MDESSLACARKSFAAALMPSSEVSIGELLNYLFMIVVELYVSVLWRIIYTIATLLEAHFATLNVLFELLTKTL